MLEREPVAGGRMRSERIATPRGDFVVDRGAQFVASGYRNMQRVVDALGLRARLHPVAKTSNAILRDGMLHAGDYGSLARVRALATALDRREVATPAAAARTRATSPPPRSVSPRARRGDRPRRSRARARAHRRRRSGGVSVRAGVLVDLRRRSRGSVERLRAPRARFVLSGFRLQAFDGGIGLLTQTLAEQVPVRTGCEVTAIETHAGGARIAIRSGARRAATARTTCSPTPSWSRCRARWSRAWSRRSRPRRSRSSRAFATCAE